MKYKTEINHTFYSDVIKYMNKQELIDLCNQLNINVFATKNGRLKSRERMAQLLAERIDLNERMFIEINFEKE